MGDSPRRLLPDFWPGGRVVCVGIIGIIKLIQQFAFGNSEWCRNELQRALISGVRLVAAGGETYWLHNAWKAGVL